MSSMVQLLMEESEKPCSVPDFFKGKNLIILILSLGLLILSAALIGVVSGKGGRSRSVDTTKTSNFSSNCSKTDGSSTISPTPEASTASVIPSLSPPQPASEGGQTICQHSECIRIAARILSSMNTSASPCDDFYNFACGRYKSLIPIPNDFNELNVHVELRLSAEDKLKDFLASPPSASDNEYETMIKQYYRSCADLDRLKSVGLQPLKSLVARLGGWPVVEGSNWHPSGSWQELSAKALSEFLVDTIVSLTVQDELETNSRTLTIKQARLMLGHYWNYWFESNKKPYLEAMITIAVEMGASEEAARTEMNEVLKFESDLAKLSEDSDGSFRRFSIASLGSVFPDLNLGLWLRTALGKWFSLPDSELVIVDRQDFFNGLGAILRRTPNRVIANYIVWRVISEYYLYLHPDYHKPMDAFAGVVPLVNITKRERRSTCYTIVNLDLKWALSATYIHRYFSKQLGHKAETLVSDIRQALRNRLNTINWLDDESRDQALQKLESMTHVMGFTDMMANKTWVLSQYDGIVIKSDDWFNTHIKLQKKRLDTIMKNFRRPPDRAFVDMDPLSAGSFYRLDTNYIVLPAVVLQYPRISSNLPSYASYAGIGFTVGHEITHGYDNQGINYHADGYKSTISWLTSDSEEEFNRRVRCLENQYSRITEPTTGYKLNGVKTLGDNIADNGGVRLAYAAFKRHDFSNEATLPGFGGYTQDQMFFMFYAANWCAQIRPSFVRKLFSEDEHALPEYRVNVPLQNFEEFAKAFQCPVGSVMNPTKKNRCDLW